MWESWFIRANAGTTECGIAGILRAIVLSRLPGAKTLLIPPEYYGSKTSGDIGFLSISTDIALLRLHIPYTNTELPDLTYNNQLINRVCLYSFGQLDKFGCLRNVYYSGYGQKVEQDPLNPPSLHDPTMALTYTRFYRTSMERCKLYSDRGDVSGKYCYSPVLRHGAMAENVTIEQFDMKNDIEFLNMPNVCGGDSGGPFIHYMKITSNNTKGLDPGYRALQLSPLHGIFAHPTALFPKECDSIHYVVTVPSWLPFGSPTRMRIPALAVGAMIWSYVDSNFWTDTMNTLETGQLARNPIHIGASFPHSG